MKLFLKGDRCYSDKCAIEKRNYPPGQHGKTGSFRKLSEFGVRMREKQKARRVYGVLEKQFSNYFAKAARYKGVTGEKLFQLLEGRLDNIVYRFGFALSRAEARQLVKHGHFLVNGRKVNIPSYQTRLGDTIELKEKSRKIEKILYALDRNQQRGLPKWLKLDMADMKGEVLEVPSKEEIGVPIDDQLIVELYSK
jgi:small subunit ribosomal protein S4